MAGDRFDVVSAGTKPGPVRREAVAVMAELGIDISAHRSKHVREFEGQAFDHVLTVCDAARETCPIFPATAERVHWSFPDPSEVQGSETAKLEQVRIIRDEIRAKIEQWCDEVCLQTAAT